MAEKPKLVEIDPWLEPYAGIIQNRIDRFQQTKASLSDESCQFHLNKGLHFSEETQNWTFREWAPAAEKLSLVGEFNGWNDLTYPLQKEEHGTWSIEVPAAEIQHGQLYKVRITGSDGITRDRIPSCATRVVQDPQTKDFSAQVWDPASPYEWKNSYEFSRFSNPCIYEAHIGMAGEEETVHGYRHFADEILPRIAAGGYNAVQLMAVAEHPYYGSFGYHVSNFFAPSSRFGTPEDLKYLIDTAHGYDLAVLMDIVHSHSVKNIAEGLNQFDGPDNPYFSMEHPQWDSMVFDYARPEVRDFLLSNISYWLEEFRFDGFRFDGVTSMLYYHFGNESFDHYDKYFVHGINDGAVQYLQLATDLIKKIKPEAIIVAEDMSGMPGLCRPIDEGGLGFTHRLAMGTPDYWIKLLKHQRDEDWDLDDMWRTLTNRRAGEANIAYAESHDQALVGDKTLAFWLMDKEMYWDMNITSKNPIIDRGIALHKLIRLITAATGGEGYLTFMGNEFGHPEWVDFPREGNDWSYKHCRRLWSVADNDELRYKHLLDFDTAMIKTLEEGFILSANPAHPCQIHNPDRILAFERNNHIFVFNLSAETAYVDYGIPVHKQRDHHIVLNSDRQAYGGFARIDESFHYPVVDGQLKLYLPPRVGLVLRPVDTT